MSRKKREWYPGAIYHVMSRGNRRTVLFKDKADYLRFLECVEKARKILGFQVHALCLMTNHFHMTIETADTELWKIMQRILHPYSIHTAWISTINIILPAICLKADILRASLRTTGIFSK